MATICGAGMAHKNLGLLASSTNSPHFPRLAGRHISCAPGLRRIQALATGTSSWERLSSASSSLFQYNVRLLAVAGVADDSGRACCITAASKGKAFKAAQREPEREPDGKPEGEQLSADKLEDSDGEVQELERGLLQLQSEYKWGAIVLPGLLKGIREKVAASSPAVLALGAVLVLSVTYVALNMQKKKQRNPSGGSSRQAPDGSRRGGKERASPRKVEGEAGHTQGQRTAAAPQDDDMAVAASAALLEVASRQLDLPPNRAPQEETVKKVDGREAEAEAAAAKEAERKAAAEAAAAAAEAEAKAGAEAKAKAAAEARAAAEAEAKAAADAKAKAAAEARAAAEAEAKAAAEAEAKAAAEARAAAEAEAKAAAEAEAKAAAKARAAAEAEAKAAAEAKAKAAAETAAAAAARVSQEAQASSSNSEEMLMRFLEERVAELEEMHSEQLESLRRIQEAEMSILRQQAGSRDLLEAEVEHLKVEVAVATEIATHFLDSEKKREEELRALRDKIAVGRQVEERLEQCQVDLEEADRPSDPALARSSRKAAAREKSSREKSVEVERQLEEERKVAADLKRRLQLESVARKELAAELSKKDKELQLLRKQLGGDEWQIGSTPRHDHKPGQKPPVSKT
eukprot:jgi/Mesen1/2180/ME000152S01269